jgi:hypothetical protein
MSKRWLGKGVEPSLLELMDDPLTHAVMRRDGLTADHVWQVIREAQRRLAAGRRLRRFGTDTRSRSGQADRAVWGDGWPATAKAPRMPEMRALRATALAEVP